MNQELTIFRNEEFQIRTIIKDGEPWFIGKDVAKILGYSNTRDALAKRVDDEDKGVANCDTLGGKQNLTIINESGLYSLILSSKLESAKRFKKWVTSEVLPTIRKTGGYISNADLMVDTYFSALDDNYKQLIKGLFVNIEEQQRKINQQQKQLEEQKPLVTFAETCLKSKDNILVRQLAKIARDEGMDMGEKRLYNKLRDWGLIMKNSTEPYQHAIDKGLFVVEEKSIDTAYGVKLIRTTKITPKGQVYVIEKLKKEIRQNN